MWYSYSVYLLESPCISSKLNFIGPKWPQADSFTYVSIIGKVISFLISWKYFLHFHYLSIISKWFMGFKSHKLFSFPIINSLYIQWCLGLYHTNFIILVGLYCMSNSLEMEADNPTLVSCQVKTHAYMCSIIKHHDHTLTTGYMSSIE